MEKRIIALLFAAVAAVTGAWAQGNDFGIWTEAGLEKSLTRRLAVGLETEFRTRDNTSEADRWSGGLSAEYKLTRWLKASAGYTLLYDHNHKVNSSGKKFSDYWGLRHRTNVSLTASHNLGRLNISLRERWQYTYRPERTVDRYWNYTDEDDDRYYGDPIVKKGITETHTYGAKSSHKWRNRLQLKYKLNKQWRPYASAESVVGSSGLDKMRYTIGTELRINKQHSVSLGYMLQNSYKDDEEGNRHVLGVGYNFKL